MANYVTHSELENSRLSLKIDLQEEIKNSRHTLAWQVQRDYNKMDDKINDYSSALKVNNVVMERMQKDITEIKETVMKMAETMPKVYATKEELKQQEEELKTIKSVWSRLIWAFLWTFWSMIIWFFIFILKKFGIL